MHSIVRLNLINRGAARTFSNHRYLSLGTVGCQAVLRSVWRFFSRADAKSANLWSRSIRRPVVFFTRSSQHVVLRRQHSGCTDSTLYRPRLRHPGLALPSAV